MFGRPSGNGKSSARNSLVLVGDKPRTQYLNECYISQLFTDGQLRKKPVVFVDCPSTLGEALSCAVMAVLIVASLCLSCLAVDPYLLLPGKIIYVLVVILASALLVQLVALGVYAAWHYRQRFMADLFDAGAHHDFPVYADLEKNARKFYSRYLKDGHAIKERLNERYADRRYTQYLLRLFDQGGSTIIFWFEEEFRAFQMAEMEITRVSSDEYHDRRTAEEFRRARREQDYRAELDEEIRRRRGEEQPNNPWDL